MEKLGPSFYSYRNNLWKTGDKCSNEIFFELELRINAFMMKIPIPLDLRHERGTPIFHFYTSWEQKSNIFLFSEGMEMEHWFEIGYIFAYWVLRAIFTLKGKLRSICFHATLPRRKRCYESPQETIIFFKALQGDV